MKCHKKLSTHISGIRVDLAIGECDDGECPTDVHTTAMLPRSEALALGKFQARSSIGAMEGAW